MQEEEKLEKVQEDADTLPTSSEDENIDTLGVEVNPTPEQMEEGNVPSQDSENIDVEGSSELEHTDVEPLTPEQEAVEKMLSQSQVNELIGRTRAEAREKALKGFFDHYGVGGQPELDGIVAKGQTYDTIHEEYLSTLEKLKEANIALALRDSGIAPEKYEDARLILQGKGLDITPENITKELETHPEWNKKIDPIAPLLSPEETIDATIKESSPAHTMFSKKGPASTISVLGNEPAPKEPEMSESDKMRELYGL